MYAFGLWEEAGEPGENPRRHWENMQTPHKKFQSLELTQQTSCCEVAALTTATVFSLLKELQFIFDYSENLVMLITKKICLEQKREGVELVHQVIGFETCVMIWVQ